MPEALQRYWRNGMVTHMSKRILSILLLLALSAMWILPAAAESDSADCYADWEQLTSGISGLASEYRLKSELASAAAPEYPKQAEPTQDHEGFDQAFREKADSGSVNHALANYSIDACALSGDKSKMTGFLGKLGFQDLAFYDFKPDGEHFAAHTIAWRFVQNEQGENVSLFVVVIRGTVEPAEWHSNFMPGDGPDHKGFKTAEMTIRKNLNAYINNPGICNGGLTGGNYKVWICGHSRGGACGNLLAVDLPASQQDVYAYLYAVPNPTKNCINNTNIHNFVICGDIVPHFVPVQYGWGRHGIVHFLDHMTVMDGVDVSSEEEIDMVYQAMYVMFGDLDDLSAVTENTFIIIMNWLGKLSINRAVDVQNLIAYLFGNEIGLGSRRLACKDRLKETGFDIRTFITGLALGANAHDTAHYQSWMRREYPDGLQHLEINTTHLRNSIKRQDVEDGIESSAEFLKRFSW